MVSNLLIGNRAFVFPYNLQFFSGSHAETPKSTKLRVFDITVTKFYVALKVAGGLRLMNVDKTPFS